MLERLLRSMSHPPHQSDAHGPNVSLAMRQLQSTIPEFAKLPPSRILDFGCGTGDHAVGLARLGHEVTGLDINSRFLATARATAAQHSVSPTFTDRLDTSAEFDVVLSYNSMEHFSDPVAALIQMRNALAQGGVIMLAFSPPWLSAYGGHMHHITPIPWVHLIFPERTVLRVRNRWYSDNAKRYEDIEGGLNRMTLRRFEKCVKRAGLRGEIRYTPMKGLPVVTRLPLIREFLTTRVTAILRPAHAGRPTRGEVVHAVTERNRPDFQADASVLWSP